MSGWAIDVRVEGAERERVAALLVQATGQAIEERDDGALVGWAADEAGAEKVRSAVSEVRGVAAAIRPLPDIDWTTEWKKGLAPRTIGRVIVTPSWIPQTPGKDQVVVTVDPETAFGSGEHGSTRGALLLLDRAIAQHATRNTQHAPRVLDLGSGSGILAIAAAKLGAQRAVAIEFDPEANPVAERNVERNGVADRVVILEGDAGELAPLGAPADLVVSNILRTVNVTLLPAILAALVPDGIAIFAGMEAPEESLFRPVLERHGLKVVDEVRDAGWWSCAVRRA
ncbi:MAG TPA: 50S ribosomal protein L11 methyltransferase [Gemmatimonadales bacterium]|nr:50S ribosomal protein L11 methyltransferase [Gemmatimonadales bacterium]